MEGEGCGELPYKDNAEKGKEKKLLISTRRLVISFASFLFILFHSILLSFSAYYPFVVYGGIPFTYLPHLRVAIFHSSRFSPVIDSLRDEMTQKDLI